MTITEFLAARLDEEESVARDMAHQVMMGRPMLQIRGGGTGIRALVDTDRILADVAAKRTIVEMMDDPRRDTYEIHAVLVELARPYAEHPDFDPDWRAQ
ncbi:DUF6221 family protein [Myceligenerans halotolerans]